MERSRELRVLAITLSQEFAASDPAFVEIFPDDDGGVIAIGTDPAEWWCGSPLAGEVVLDEREARRSGPLEVI